MTDSIIILLAILITANVLLIVLALWRTVQRRRRERDETTARPVATAGRPASGANGTAASVDRGPATAGAVSADARATPPRTDPLTGLLRQTEWDRILIDEAARIDRYGRPATVVFIDVEGLDKLTSVLGPAAGDRILPALASVLAARLVAPTMSRGSGPVASASC